MSIVFRLLNIEYSLIREYDLFASELPEVLLGFGLYPFVKVLFRSRYFLPYSLITGGWGSR